MVSESLGLLNGKEQGLSQLQQLEGDLVSALSTHAILQTLGK